MCGFRGRFVLFCIYPAWCSVNFGSETWCLTLIWEKFSNHYYFKYCFCSFLFSFVAIPQSLDIVLLFRSFYLCLMVSQFSIHTSLSSEIFLFSHDSILMSPWKTLFIHSITCFLIWSFIFYSYWEFLDLCLHYPPVLASDLLSPWKSLGY